jgi:uncharacterized membrane protein
MPLRQDANNLGTKSDESHIDVILPARVDLSKLEKQSYFLRNTVLLSIIFVGVIFGYFSYVLFSESVSALGRHHYEFISKNVGIAGNVAFSVMLLLCNITVVKIILTFSSIWLLEKPVQNSSSAV